MFGVLKFADPFKSWYAVQITGSSLGEFSYWLGLSGEIVVGLMLMMLAVYRRSFPVSLQPVLTLFFSFALIVVMVAAIFVHLHPGVPAEVLPLKIKPPFIPAAFLALAAINSLLIIKQLRRGKKVIG